MANFVLKGHICQSQDRTHLGIRENHYLVCVEDRCAGVYPILPAKYRSLPMTDYGDKLIMPGMVDLHLHAPQFSFRGLGMDMELLDWLNTHTFPEEAKYADLDYAAAAYGQFAAHLRRSETTRACIFATVHVPATQLLMEQMEQLQQSKDQLVSKQNEQELQKLEQEKIRSDYGGAVHHCVRARNPPVVGGNGREVAAHQAHSDAPVYSLLHRRPDVPPGGSAGGV